MGQMLKKYKILCLKKGALSYPRKSFLGRPRFPGRALSSLQTINYKGRQKSGDINWHLYLDNINLSVPGFKLAFIFLAYKICLPGCLLVSPSRAAPSFASPWF